MISDKNLVYLQKACGIADIGTTVEILDMILVLYDLVTKYKGETNIQQVVSLKIKNDLKYKKNGDKR